MLFCRFYIDYILLVFSLLLYFHIAIALTTGIMMMGDFLDLGIQSTECMSKIINQEESKCLSFQSDEPQDIVSEDQSIENVRTTHKRRHIDSIGSGSSSNSGNSGSSGSSGNSGSSSSNSSSSSSSNMVV